MSDIQNDKEPLQGRRKNKLGEDAVAPLRDQIPAKLLEKLQDMDMAAKLSGMWHRGNARRAEWLDRQHTFLADWDNFVEADSTGALSNVSNLHLPMVFTVVKTYHARMMAALAVSEPYLRPRREDSIAGARAATEVLKYALKDWANGFGGIEDVLDDWLWQWVTTGVGIKKWRWDVKFERFMDVRLVPELQAPRFEVDPETGIETVIPNMQIVEKEQTVTEKVFEGPWCETISAEDLLIIGGGGDPDRADAVMHSQWLTASELWTLVDRKIFDEDAVRTVIESGPDSQLTGDSSGIKGERASRAGMGEVDHEADLDRYQIIECYIALDVDGSGINSEVVVWFHRQTNKLLRATYLRRINKAGDRPFVKIDFFRRNGQEYGMGLVEVLHPLAVEMDAMHNIRIDFGMMSAMPFGFYRASSSIAPEKLTYEPGTLIPVDNPQTDVFFPNLGNRAAFGFQEEAALQNLVERLTGVSELSLGVQTGTQGALRTATGARALLQEQNANLDVHLKRLMRGWKKSQEYLLHMLQQRIPPGLSFRVTGEDGNDYFAKIRNSVDIMGDFDFEVDPNSASSNPAVREQRANMLVQITGSPLDIQLGIITPRHRYEALKTFLQSQDIKDFSRYIQQPPGSRLILSPEEELNRVIRGIPVPVLPESDHEGYLNFFDMISKSDELLGQFNQEQVLAAAQQAQAHQQMLEALQQQQAQVANQQQQAAAAGSPGLQAGPAAGPLGEI